MRLGKKGFSLVQLAILTAVVGAVAVVMIPNDNSSDSNKEKITKDKFSQIEDRMIAFMTENGRRPCPADASLAVSAANFGVEAANPGTCTGGTPAANLAGVTHAVMGMVPTKALKLPDDMAFDAWGRRIAYYVDTYATKATGANSCATMGATGVLDLRATAAGATTENDMVLYVSAGRDGFGAFGAQGQRLNAGTPPDNDTLLNASVASAAGLTSGTMDAANMHKKVKKDTSATFNSIVWVPRNTRNTCAIAGAANGVGTPVVVACTNTTPSFTKGADQDVASNAGAVTVAAWATALSKGTNPCESTQTLAFTRVSATNSAMFSVLPAISPTGTLTYTIAAAAATATSVVTIYVTDSAGMSSANQSFNIYNTNLADPSCTYTGNGSGHGLVVCAIAPGDAGEVLP